MGDGPQQAAGSATLAPAEETCAAPATGPRSPLDPDSGSFMVGDEEVVSVEMAQAPLSAPPPLPTTPATSELGLAEDEPRAVDDLGEGAVNEEATVVGAWSAWTEPSPGFAGLEPFGFTEPTAPLADARSLDSPSVPVAHAPADAVVAAIPSAPSAWTRIDEIIAAESFDDVGIAEFEHRSPFAPVRETLAEHVSHEILSELAPHEPALEPRSHESLAEHVSHQTIAEHAQRAAADAGAADAAGVSRLFSPPPPPGSGLVEVFSPFARVAASDAIAQVTSPRPVFSQLATVPAPLAEARRFEPEVTPERDLVRASASLALAEAEPGQGAAWVTPPAPLVLIVSDGLQDWRGCELLLRVNGMEVRVARDAVEALALVRRGAVAVVLTAYVQARRTGLELCEAVHQASPATQVLLFVASAPPPAVRQRISVLPCVRLVAATAPQPDVLNAVRQALECTMGFSGSFFGVSMVDLLQLFHLSRRTVSVFLGGPVSGSVHFDAGEVIHVEALALTGEDALLEILDWNAGTVRMSVLSAGARTVDRPFHNLLLDTLRRLDERRAPADAMQTKSAEDIVAAIERALSEDADSI